MFPHGSAGRDRPVRSSHSSAVSLPWPCSGGLRRLPKAGKEVAEYPPCSGKGKVPRAGACLPLVTHGTCFGFRSPVKGRSTLAPKHHPSNDRGGTGVECFLPATSRLISVRLRSPRVPIAAAGARVPGRSSAAPSPCPGHRSPRRDVRQMDAFPSGFRHSLPSFLPAWSCLRPGPIPNAHQKITTKGETGKEEKKGQKQNLNPL